MSHLHQGHHIHQMELHILKKVMNTKVEKYLQVTCIRSAVPAGDPASVGRTVTVSARHGSQDVVQQRDTEQRLQH